MENISCTLIKDQCRKPKKDSYLRISEAKWLLNLKTLYNTQSSLYEKIHYLDPIRFTLGHTNFLGGMYSDLFN